jgi:hypothetical protein
MSPWRRLAPAALAMVSLACGAKAPANAPSHANTAHPSPPFASPPPTAPGTTATHAPFASPATTAPPPAGAPMPESWPREMQILGAVLTLENELRQLQGALSTCDLACRSLASMERSVRIICSLTEHEDQTRCNEARKRLKEARVRVRDACKSCNDGTQTDPDGPG